MSVTSSATVTLLRRVSGPAALMATAGGVAAIALHDRVFIDWPTLSFAGVLAVAAVGLGRRSMVGQVLSRGAAWSVVVPTAFVAAVTTLGHRPDLAAVGLFAGSAASLLLARPMLHTKEARAEFAPVRYRSWLLAAATFATTTGIALGGVALDMLRWSSDRYLGALAMGALGVSMIASAVGVVRMRAWGVLLGGATAIATLLYTLVRYGTGVLSLDAVFTALPALPGLMMILPVLLAQRGRSRDASVARTTTRIATAAAEPARYRIAEENDVREEGLTEEDAPAPRRRASLHA